MLSIRTCDMCRAVMGPWLGERLSSMAVSTQCTQHGSGEGGGVPSQLKVIQLRGTADPPPPLSPPQAGVCRQVSFSLSAPGVFPSHSEDECAAAGWCGRAAGRQGPHKAIPLPPRVPTVTSAVTKRVRALVLCSWGEIVFQLTLEVLQCAGHCTLQKFSFGVMSHTPLALKNAFLGV